MSLRYRNTAEVVSVMQKTLMGIKERLVLEIRRNFIVKDSLKEAKKERFDVKKFVKVHTHLHLGACMAIAKP